jgi:hypothetical protein
MARLVDADRNERARPEFSAPKPRKLFKLCASSSEFFKNSLK